MVNAEFWDIFGFFGFIVIGILGILILKRYKKVPDWIGGLLLLIGIAGAFIDGVIVARTYIFGG